MLLLDIEDNSSLKRGFLNPRGAVRKGEAVWHSLTCEVKKGDRRAKSLNFSVLPLFLVLLQGPLFHKGSPCLCSRIYSVCKVSCSSGDGWDVCVYPALFAARYLMSYTWLEMWLHRGQSSAFSGMHFLDAHFKLHGYTGSFFRENSLLKPILYWSPVPAK